MRAEPVPQSARAPQRALPADRGPGGGGRLRARRGVTVSLEAPGRCQSSGATMGEARPVGLLPVARAATPAPERCEPGVGL